MELLILKNGYRNTAGVKSLKGAGLANLNRDLNQLILSKNK